MKRALGALLAAAIAAAGGSASAEPVKIRIGWANVSTHLTSIVAAAPKEIYKHWGDSYMVEPVFIAGSGPALTALAANEIQLGGMSSQALVLAVTEAKLDLKVIGQQVSGGVGGYATTEYWARDDIKRIEDLKGKVVGVNARGSTSDAAVKATLIKHGLKDGQDYQIVEMRFSALLPALESKRVDVAILLQPFNLKAAKIPGMHVLFTYQDSLGEVETVVWMGKADWIAKNRAALVDFLEDNIRLRAWLYDPKNHDAAVKLLAGVAKSPVEDWDEWAFTKKDNYRDPHALVNVARYQRNIDDLHKLGILPTSLDVSKYVDNSLAEEAAKRVH
jgi:ABC-type nitrate/sulfonate/bicarbonate transport system substrate-binding protein